MSKTFKVLMVISDVAGGHRSAAVALTQAFQRNFGDRFDVETVDYNQLKFPGYTDEEGKIIGPSSVFHLIERVLFDRFHKDGDGQRTISNFTFAEGIFNLAFNLLALRYGLGRKVLDFIVNSAYWHRNRTLMLEEKPDLVISIHPFITIALDEYIRDRRKNNLSTDDFFYVNCITEISQISTGWVSEFADMTFAPTEMIVDDLKKYGRTHLDSIVSGYFPIKEGMDDACEPDEINSKLYLDKGKENILVMGGGTGIYSAMKVLKYLAPDKNVNIIVITGNSVQARERLERNFGDFENVRIRGFEDRIQDFINWADIVVTKPGPATIFELELIGVKAIFTKYIGAQESKNHLYAIQNPNFRYAGDDVDLVLKYIDELRVAEFKPFCRRSPHESDEIVKKIAETFLQKKGV